jgi:hypothetical protein
MRQDQITLYQAALDQLDHRRKNLLTRPPGLAAANRDDPQHAELCARFRAARTAWQGARAALPHQRQQAQTVEQELEQDTARREQLQSIVNEGDRAPRR